MRRVDDENISQCRRLRRTGLCTVFTKNKSLTTIILSMMVYPSLAIQPASIIWKAFCHSHLRAWSVIYKFWYSWKLHSEYIRKRAPAQLVWRWLISFRLPLLNRRRRCRPFRLFLLVRSLWKLYEGMQVFLVRQPKLDSRACALCNRVDSDDASVLNRTHTNRQTRSAGVFTVHVSLQMCRRARTFFIFSFYLRQRKFSVGC